MTQQVFNALSQLPSKNLLHHPRLESAVPVTKLCAACLRPAAPLEDRPDTHADDDLEDRLGAVATVAEIEVRSLPCRNGKEPTTTATEDIDGRAICWIRCKP